MRRLRNLQERGSLARGADASGPPARRADKFVLTAALGNDAMQTGEDVARALRDVADKLDRGDDSGSVRDENGNAVGQWELK